MQQKQEACPQNSKMMVGWDPPPAQEASKVMIPMTGFSAETKIKSVSKRWHYTETIWLKILAQSTAFLLISTVPRWERLRAGEGDNRGWDGWVAYRLSGHGFGWTPGVGDGQGGLVCCGSRGRKEWDTTERLNWTVPWQTQFDLVETRNKEDREEKLMTEGWPLEGWRLLKKEGEVVFSPSPLFLWLWNHSPQSSQGRTPLPTPL